MGINPITLSGNWDEGFALDNHVISSIPIGEDVYGHMQFDTTRSEMGELLFHFKYRNKYDNLQPIISLAKPFLMGWNALKIINSVLPVPSATDRLYQPAFEIAREIANIMGVVYFETVLQKISPVKAKDLAANQKQLISGTIVKTQEAKKKHDMLLVDDLYQTGSTLTECVNVLRQDPNIGKIYVLTMTKTKR